MRIIGGELRGKSILPPAGYSARPTTDFAKEGLFNTLTNELDFTEISLLDLFSGTGSISFEFASRGCTDIIAVEMNPANAAFVKKTAAGFKLHSIQVIHHNVFDFIPLCKRKFDVIFADPPFSIEGLESIPEKIFFADIITTSGYLILEHPATYSFTSAPYFVKEKKYGNVHFSYFKKE